GFRAQAVGELLPSFPQLPTELPRAIWCSPTVRRPRPRTAMWSSCPKQLAEQGEQTNQLLGYLAEKTSCAEMRRCQLAGKGIRGQSAVWPRNTKSAMLETIYYKGSSLASISRTDFFEAARIRDFEMAPDVLQERDQGSYSGVTRSALGEIPQGLQALCSMMLSLDSRFEPVATSVGAECAETFEAVNGLPEEANECFKWGKGNDASTSENDRESNATAEAT
ncbi:unnamed protein product, partial [Prorocentrum cordatum]